MEFFVKRKPKPTTNIMANFWGDTGTGKSTLALTFPKPLYIINVDRPMDHLLVDLKEDDYYWIDIPPPVNETQIAAQAVRDRVERAIDEVVREATEGTLILDGFSPFMALLNVAFVGKVADVMPKEYGERNQWVRTQLKKVAFGPVHFVMTNEQDEVWSGARTKAVGMYKSDGYAKQGHSLNVEGRMFVETVGLNGTPQHVLQFNTGSGSGFKFDTRFNGKQIVNPTFEKIHKLAFPEQYGPEAVLWQAQVLNNATAGVE